MTQKLKKGDRITVTLTGIVEGQRANGDVDIKFDGSRLSNTLWTEALAKSTIVVEKPPLKVGEVYETRMSVNCSCIGSITDKCRRPTTKRLDNRSQTCYNPLVVSG